MTTVQIGDSVRITYQQIAAEQLADIDGWQGRVEEIQLEGEQSFVLIELDSITLQHLPENYIQNCLEKMIPFDYIMLPIEFVEQTSSRDLPIDVHNMQTALSEKYSSPLDTLNSFLGGLIDDEDDELEIPETPEIDLVEYYEHLELKTKKERGAVERAFKRGFKAYCHYDYMNPKDWIQDIIMSKPNSFGFGALEVMRDSKIQPLTKTKTCDYLLPRVNSYFENGVPIALMAIAASMASMEVLTAPMLTAIAANVEMGVYRSSDWSDILLKQEMADLAEWLLVQEDLEDNEKIWWINYFVHALENNHHIGSVAVKTAFVTEGISAETKKRLCTAWLADANEVGTPPLQWQLMQAQENGDLNKLSSVIERMDLPPELQESFAVLATELENAQTDEPQIIENDMLRFTSRPFNRRVSWTPTSAKRLSIPMLVTLGEDAYATCQKYLGAAAGRDFQKDAMHQAVSDLLKAHHDKLSAEQIRNVIEMGLDVGRMPTRKIFYKTSIQFFGTEYLEKSLNDEAASLQKWGAKELAKYK